MHRYVRTLPGLSLGALLVCLVAAMPAAEAASFEFGSGGVRNTVVGLPTADVTNGGYTLTLEAGPAGALLDDSDSDGLGVDSSGIAGATDDDPTKLNIIDGTAPVSGQGESITLSFDRPGVLTELLFDGLKDETLEYFSIELPDSTVLSFFDFEVEMRLNDQGFQLSDLGVPNVTQALDASDDLTGLFVPFAAGDRITITYGEIDFTNVLPGYVPLVGGVGNGSRFEGLSIVPEPASLALGGLSLVLLVLSRPRRFA